MTEHELWREDLPADLEAARQLVFGLAARGIQAWHMCIPPQRSDSDILLMRIIDAAERLHRENEELRAVQRGS